MVPLFKNCMICSPQEMDWRDSIKEDEMGGTCGTYGEMRGMYRGW